MGKLPVLVVEDDEALRRLLAEILQNDGFMVTGASSAEEGLDLFRSGEFDLVVTDIRLPGMNGLELLGKIKKEQPETEVIVVTASASLESALIALRSGALDYLLKPFGSLKSVSEAFQRAATRILLAREDARQRSELRLREETLEKVNRLLVDLAIRDGLTGVYNVRYFREFLQMEIARAPRQSAPFSLIFLDVDHFKGYNDTYGHIEGDRILCQLAGLLLKRFRKMDLIARYGGEEFVILLPETSKDVAFTLAEETRRAIAEHPFECGKEAVSKRRITASMGVASFPDDGEDPETLLRKADAALYRAKAEGRNCVRRGMKNDGAVGI